MAFAAPAGGILCDELLRPTVHALPKVANDPQLRRSNIIQKLSLLVGFLDWVRPPSPNGDLCANCKRIIQHVLDHTLNSGGRTSGPDGGASAEFFDTSNWDFSTQLDFNFELLDTFDFLRPEISSSQSAS